VAPHSLRLLLGRRESPGVQLMSEYAELQQLQVLHRERGGLQAGRTQSYRQRPLSCVSKLTIFPSVCKNRCSTDEQSTANNTLVPKLQVPRIIFGRSCILVDMEITGLQKMLKLVPPGLETQVDTMLHSRNCRPGRKATGQSCQVTLSLVNYCVIYNY
jgi:hypothetical protein